MRYCNALPVRKALKKQQQKKKKKKNFNENKTCFAALRCETANYVYINLLCRGDIHEFMNELNWTKLIREMTPGKAWRGALQANPT